MKQENLVYASLGVLALVAIGFAGFFIFNGMGESEQSLNSATEQQQSQEINQQEDNSGGNTEVAIDNENTPNSMDSNSDSDDMQVTGISGYEEYSQEKLAMAGDNTVVLFFKADWCTTCSALDRDIVNNASDIPSNVLILEVPYDTRSGATDEELELARRNGVASQHTLMVVNSEGNKIQDLNSVLRLSQLLDSLSV